MSREENLREITPDEFEHIPGMHFLTHVGPLRSEATPDGSRLTVRGTVHVPSASPIMRGRSEMSHVVFLEAANNLSHWFEAQVPELEGITFKVPVAFPRGMGMPPLLPDEDIPVRGEVWFQQSGGRWRAEVDVKFFRSDGTLAETVNFPLIERR